MSLLVTNGSGVVPAPSRGSVRRAWKCGGASSALVRSSQRRGRCKQHVQIYAAGTENVISILDAVAGELCAIALISSFNIHPAVISFSGRSGLAETVLNVSRDVKRVHLSFFAYFIRVAGACPVGLAWGDEVRPSSRPAIR